jgi:hypothetical protein
MARASTLRLALLTAAAAAAAVDACIFKYGTIEESMVSPR